MTALEERLLERTNRLIVKGESVYSQKRAPAPNVISDDYVPTQPFEEWKSQSLSLLTALSGVSAAAASYLGGFRDGVQHPYAAHVGRGLGTLRAVKEDIENGHLYSVQQLAASEVFADFLEMAAHLYESGYLVPSASLAGAVLEEGLRQRAIRSELKAKNLESLNDVLFQAKLLSPIAYKQVKVWIDIRNAADHGQFDKLEEASVGSMIDGVRDLLGKIE